MANASASTVPLPATTLPPTTVAQTELLKRLLIAEELTAVGVAKSAADLRSQTELAQAKWRIFTYVFFAVAIYLLTKYFTATLTYADMVQTIDKALQSSDLTIHMSGTKIALAFNYPIVNYFVFGGGEFATAVVWAYYTPAFSSDFVANLETNLRKMYDLSRGNMQLSAKDIICTAFGKKANDEECLKFCQQPATASIVDGLATTFSFAIGLAPFEFPVGLIAGIIGGVGTFLFRANSQYQKCRDTQANCIRTNQTACRFVR